MKKVNLLFLLLLAGTLAHGNPDSLFHRGNTRYAEGQYEKALAAYDSLLHSGFESAELYYNMGNAAFRSNKLGFAILYYEKALKLNPSMEEAQVNLDYVSRFKEDNLEKVPELFIKTWIRSLVLSLSANGWGAASLLLFALFLAALAAYIFARRMAVKKSGFFSGLLLLVLFILSITAANQRHRQLVDPNKAIIVNPSAVVKSSPSSSGTDLFVLHEGTKVSTDEMVNQWMEIRISDGRIGWIPASSLESI